MLIWLHLSIARTPTTPRSPKVLNVKEHNVRRINQPVREATAPVVLVLREARARCPLTTGAARLGTANVNISQN